MIEAGRALASGKKPKANVRFGLTNIQCASHRLHNRLYCPWGAGENQIKELEGGIQMDRTSCSRFKANRFRLLAAPYPLTQELRWRVRNRGCQIGFMNYPGWDSAAEAIAVVPCLCQRVGFGGRPGVRLDTGLRCSKRALIIRSIIPLARCRRVFTLAIEMLSSWAVCALVSPFCKRSSATWLNALGSIAITSRSSSRCCLSWTAVSSPSLPPNCINYP